MPNASETVNDVAKIALDLAMKKVAEAALPWTTPDKVIESIRAELTPDFAAQVNSYVRFIKFLPNIERLGKYVGVLAAYLADLEKGFQPKAGTLTLAQVETALMLVKAACPDLAVPGVRGVLCTRVLVKSAGTLPDIRRIAGEWVSAKKR
jgi:hypothetical protein